MAIDVPPLPRLSIGDVTVGEDVDTGQAIFTVSLSHVSHETVSVRYATSNWRANSRSDYARATGTLTIPAGESSATIAVGIRNDGKQEPDESFYVTLSKPQNSTLERGRAVGTIVNDDFALYLAAGSRRQRAAEKLTADELALVTDEAIRRWALAVGEAAASGLSTVQWELADLPGTQLGVASGQTVRIDRNAAGRGWFVDASPWDDEEFLGSLATGDLRARPDGPTANRVDLLTAVMHELGHVLGLSEVPLRGELMRPALGLGRRCLPDL
jgi:hypothetical protein